MHIISQSPPRGSGPSEQMIGRKLELLPTAMQEAEITWGMA